MNDNHPRPISQSYWVEPGRFLAGEYPGQYSEETSRQQLDAFLEAGFHTFIDLTGSNETVPYRGILLEEARTYDVEVNPQKFPIGDMRVPSPETMLSILDTIDDALQNGRKIYVHCLGGIGRTGTTVGCYLVRRGLSGEEALNQLSVWWRTVPKSRIHFRSPETSDQMDFIRNWHLHDIKRMTSE
jgi:protein tyrosine/serine phosphatase